MPVQRVVGGVEVECDLRRRLVVGIEKQIDEQPLHGVSIGGDLVVAGGLGRAAFQPVQRTLAGQGRAVGAAGSEFLCEHRHDRVIAEFVMVIEVLIAQCDGDHTLHYQCCHRVFGVGWIAAVLEAGSETLGEVQHTVGRTQQQRASIRADAPAVEGRNHRAAFNACKLE
jgi:hypothetical protein